MTTTSSTSTTLSPAAAVEAAYRAGWDAYIAYGGGAGPFKPDEFSAAIGPYFTGDEYKRLFDYLQLLRLKGQVLKGTVSLSPKVMSVTGTSASLQDCYDDHDLGVYGGDGKRVDTVTPARTAVDVEAALDGGAWKVSKITPKGRGCTAA